MQGTEPAPKVKPPKMEESPTSRVSGEFWLTWSFGPSPKANDPNAKVSLRATNNNKDPVYLNALSFEFKSGGRGGALFAATDFKWLNHADPPKETTTPPAAPAPAASGLPAPAAPGGSGAGSAVPTTPKRPSNLNEVELVQSPGSPARKLECNLLEAGKGFTKWIVKIVADKEKFITIPPGAWTEVAFNGRVNGAMTYDIHVDEDWKTASGKPNDHFGMPIKIVVKS